MLLARQACVAGCDHQNEAHDNPGREQMLHGADPPGCCSEFGCYNVGDGTWQVYP
jgi:hypothetical protein